MSALKKECCCKVQIFILKMSTQINELFCWVLLSGHSFSKSSCTFFVVVMGNRDYNSPVITVQKGFKYAAMS